MAVLSMKSICVNAQNSESIVKHGRTAAGSRALRCLALAVLLTPALAACGSIKSNVSDIAGKVAHPELQTPKSCAGWEKIDLKNKTRFLLMQKDAVLLMNIDSHNLRGQNLGCWN